MHRGYVKFWRKILDWEWFTSSETFHLFAYLFLAANHNDGNYKGIEVKRGQILTGRKSLSEKTGISQRTIRTALNRLKSTGEIAIKTTNKFSLITLCNYETYNSKFESADQQNDQQTVQRVTSNRPATDQQPTTNKNVKNDKNENKTTYFTIFWKKYPKKKSKGQAEKAWNKIQDPKNTLDKILIALEWQTTSDDWKKDNGQFIPYPATYLNGKMWEDEKTEITNEISDEDRELFAYEEC